MSNTAWCQDLLSSPCVLIVAVFKECFNAVFPRGRRLAERTCHAAALPLGLWVSLLQDGPEVSAQEVRQLQKQSSLTLSP